MSAHTKRLAFSQIVTVTTRAVIALLFFLNSSEASTLGWYEQESYRCQGASSLASVFSGAGWFQKKIDLVGTAPASGKIHIRETLERIHAVTAAQGASVIDAYVFTPESAPKFRAVLQSIEASQRAPYVAQALLDLVKSYALTPIADIGLTGFSEWLIEKRNADTVSFGDLRGLVASGGVLERTLAFYQHADKQRWALITDSYRVSVGQEQRTIILSSCIYPVETLVAEFATHSGTNDKIVRPIDSKQWHKFDIESNKYDRTILNYVGQDEEFYYFNEDDEQQRISFRGGTWQLKNNPTGWATFYSRVDAN